MIIRAHHLRLPQGFSPRGGFCAAKSRSWAEAHGFNWRQFVREGIDGDALRATGDPMAIACVDAAEAAAALEASRGR